jgi:hypothetical protein
MSRPTIRDLISSRRASTLASAANESNLESISSNLSSGFETVIVKEVISNPVEYFNRAYREENGKNFLDALKDSNSGMGIANPELIDLAPRNSILGFNVSAGDSQNPLPELFFPFFPPHLAFPVKPGEAVWVFYEDMGEGRRNGYWLCRKSSYRQVDDVNFTAQSRENTVAKLQDASQDGKSELSDDAKEHAIALMSSFPQYPGLQITSDDLVSDSISYREEFVGEPVPRYSKKCGDLVLQGSNNTLISLGIDRSFTESSRSDMVGGNFDGIDSLTSAFDTNQNSSANIDRFKPEMAGCIDLVAGRGALDLNKDLLIAGVNDMIGISNSGLISGIDRFKGSSDIIENVRVKAESLTYYEINKGSEFTGHDNESPDEGSFSTLLDSEARFYVSMRSTPNAKYPSAVETLVGNNSDIRKSLNDYYGSGKSAIVGSAYSIKSYARGNCELQTANGGSMFISDGVVIASSGGAYIHLKPNGDISLVPGPTGTIKLGGEDASLAVLGNDNLSSQGGAASNAGPIQLPSSSPGHVMGTPVVSTAGGTVGMAQVIEAGAAGTGVKPPPNGKFATKILMK